GVPFWRTDLVLAGRFDVGVGGGGAKLGAPWDVLAYLWQVAGDFTAGWSFVLTLVVLLAAAGMWQLRRSRPASALLAGVVFAVPALALLLARLGDSAAPESRHLIFALPFFATLVAVGVLELARTQAHFGPALAVVAIGVVLGSEVAWARQRTPPLFAGEPSAAAQARREAGLWLARTGRADDVLFGYEPVYLRAWERTRGGPTTVVPRADAKLALRALRAAPKPLGRGVWVFDASEAGNAQQRLSIPVRLPAPAGAFEARSFGPYLVIRTRRPTRTPRRYLLLASQVMIVGKDLLIGDADVNFVTVRRALARLGERAKTLRSPRVG
ncbi:MAG: hypothetical protein ICV64_12970, partial [Thermoleophilia bacterium]|nr:hypothetical protein [Thermoleophilia bacterium]